jgi:hypothetical protein
MIMISSGALIVRFDIFKQEKDQECDNENFVWKSIIHQFFEGKWKG